MKIAIAGKGGTGKTTSAALLVRYLIGQRQTPILAVDADPNANLHEALGMEFETSIAEMLSEFQKNKDAVPAGMSKDQYVEYQLQSSLMEGKDVDLLVMGGPEGAGCYCYANNLLRSHLERLGQGYKHVIMDNEAGLEHLSRRTTNDLDCLLIVSDATARGLRSARRVKQIVMDIELQVKQLYLIVTKTATDETHVLEEEIKKTDLPVLGFVPRDRQVAEYDLQGRPLYDLPNDSPAVKATEEMFARLLEKCVLGKER